LLLLNEYLDSVDDDNYAGMDEEEWVRLINEIMMRGDLRGIVVVCGGGDEVRLVENGSRYITEERLRTVLASEDNTHDG
jgi:hypothetical protein